MQKYWDSLLSPDLHPCYQRDDDDDDEYKYSSITIKLEKYDITEMKSSWWQYYDTEESSVSF